MAPSHLWQPRHGFSLLELSIVLVILGLLTGGILAGRSLIHAAELRSVSVDLGRYKTAMVSFRDKYLYLPGDMPNAVRFWGAQAGGTLDGTSTACLALDYTTPSTDKATCNGNGDGFIAYSASAFNMNQMESYRLWQHLANAGLIEGQYTGVNNSAILSNALRWGTNAPASRLQNAGYVVSYNPSNWEVTAGLGAPGATYFMETKYDRNILMMATIPLDTSMGVAMPSRNVLSPAELWNIDSKMDDGKAGQGVVLATGPFGGSTCTTSSNVNGLYNLQNASKSCAMVYIIGL